MNNITYAKHGGLKSGSVQSTKLVDSVDNLLILADRPVSFSVYADNLQGSTYGYTSPDKKMLIKSTGNPDTDSYISVVNKSYQVIENDEILSPLHNQMVEFFDPSLLSDIKIIDSMTKDASKCYSEYQFPRISRELGNAYGHNTTFQFRIIVKNTFDGSSQATMYCGLIDMFCLNGNISGQFDVAKARHSKNYNVDGFSVILQKSFERFEEEMNLYQSYADSKLKSVSSVEDLFKRLTSRTEEVQEAKRGNTLADRLFAQYAAESTVRGHNAFSVMSALTHYASHDDDRFALKVNADASSLYKRQEKVASWLSSKTWRDFVDNATQAKTLVNV
jgi:hypothetical protein